MPSLSLIAAVIVIVCGFVFQYFIRITPLNIEYTNVSSLRDSYDYIIVGAGTAGSVLAVRLALDPSFPSVLVIEAGDKADTSWFAQEMIPIRTIESELTDKNWNFMTEPQEKCCSNLNDQRVHWPRGKIMGGSSVCNFMMWVWGHPNDWNNINVDGWRWKDILPFFKKVENYIPFGKNPKKSEKRGTNGPIIVNDHRNLNDFKLASKFVEAGRSAGYDVTSDYNSDQIGFGNVQFNVDNNGRRNNAFVGYMRYLLSTNEYKNGKINLDILPNSHVTKILFDKKNNHKAIGVEFMNKNKLYKQVNTKKEVIISGGAIGSPQILMLSGIGPKEELTKHSIPIIEELPGVGSNLHDHPLWFARYHTNDQYENENAVLKHTLNGGNYADLLNFVFRGKGHSTTSAVEGVAFLMNDKEYSSENVPYFEFEFGRGITFNVSYFNQIDNIWKINKCGDMNLFKDVNNVQSHFVFGTLLHPTSRGFVKLNNSDPLSPPLIDPKYLTTDYDMKMTIKGFRAMLKVMNEPSMKETYDSPILCESFGGNYMDPNADDQTLEKYLRGALLTNYHPVGTCKMGDVNNDNMAVVDYQLKVKNFQNLRVVDASTFAEVSSGNTQAPSYMIGEKAADIILNDK